MATLEIRDLHVSVEEAPAAAGDPARRRSDRVSRADPRDHGPERLRQVDPRVLDRRSPEVPGDQRVGDPGRRGRAGDDRGRAGPGRAVPGHAVPGRGARRVGVELPAHGDDRGPRRGAEAARLGQGAARAMAELAIDPAFAQRNLNEGFSGGEKKRHEILQLELLKPKIAILDETDSGLDIDALQGRVRGHQPGPGAGQDHGVLLITHYTRILRYVKPDFVHVFVGGRIVDGAARSWPRSWRTRATRSIADQTRGRPGMTFDVARIRKDFPILDRACGAGSRWSTWTARTPRRSRARSSTRWTTSTSSTTRTSTGPATSSARRPPRPTRAPGSRSASSSARGRDRGRVHQEHLRGDQPGRLLDGQRDRRRSGPVQARPRRRDRHHRDGAPLQHRPVAAALPAHRRHAALVRGDPGRPARPVATRRADQRRAPSWSRWCTSPTCWAPSTRSA